MNSREFFILMLAFCVILLLDGIVSGITESRHAERTAIAHECASSGVAHLNGSKFIHCTVLEKNP